MRFNPLFCFLPLFLAQALASQVDLAAAKLAGNMFGSRIDESTKVAVIQRRKGGETRFECQSVKEWRLKLQLPDRRVHFPPQTCFFVQGLTKLSQFDDFLDHPEGWTWAQVRMGLTGGMQMRSGVVRKGETPRFRGKILGPEGKPLTGIDVRFWRQLPERGDKEVPSQMHWGYDPCTGRFWAQKTEATLQSGRHLLDLLPRARFWLGNAGLAPRCRVDWPSGKEAVFKLEAAGSVMARVLGLAGASHIRYEASLFWDLDAGRSIPTVRARSDVTKFVHFSGLPAGSYRLEIRRWGAKTRIFVQRGLIVGAGQALRLEPIDLRSKLRQIQLQVLGERQRPLRAKVLHVAAHMSGDDLVVLSGHFATDKTGVCTLLVPHAGVDLCVFAPDYGPQVFRRVRQDLKVILQHPRRIDLRLRGLDKHPELVKNLQVRAQPIAGYPRWAWQALVRADKLSRTRRRGSARARGETILATARLDSGQTVRMDIPFAGRWKFELTYVHRNRSLRLPLPELDSVEIDISTVEVPIEVPIPELERVHTEFLRQTRIR